MRPRASLKGGICALELALMSAHLRRLDPDALRGASTSPPSPTQLPMSDLGFNPIFKPEACPFFEVCQRSVLSEAAHAAVLARALHGESSLLATCDRVRVVDHDLYSQGKVVEGMC